MEYQNLKKLKEKYDKGINITSYIKELEKNKNNSLNSIEISYDLQAGSYIDIVKNKPHQFNAYCDDISDILSRYILEGDRILDCGTGEMTTLSFVAKKSFTAASRIYCFDLSLSRVIFGVKFAKEFLKRALFEKVEPFIAELSRIPMLDKSIDVVWTSHALEPNHGREKEILSEIFRVARRKVTLFEPSYENNTTIGKKRMEDLGYIRGLESQIESLGGVIEDMIRLDSRAKAVNPTYAYIIHPHAQNNLLKTTNNNVYACPTTKTPLIKSEHNFFYSEDSMLAYPIMSDIPILRSNKAIVACHSEKY